MKNDRRKFIRNVSLAGLGMAGGDFLSDFFSKKELDQMLREIPENKFLFSTFQPDNELSIIGLYGKWAASLNGNRLPSFSFRRKEWTDINKWKKVALERLNERLATPDIGKAPEPTIVKQYTYDSLHIEELSWQLPYGRPTSGILLKPENATGKLPAILALHDHAGNKYFGTKKITRTGDDQHPMMAEHQKNIYGGRPWANDIAKRGYVVLVPDAFAFGSRRVMLQDVPERLRNGLNDDNPEDPKNIKAYNTWAGNHEAIMSKALYCAGTTWAGVFFAEDRIALDILEARNDVDKNRIGCGGLSGGGTRTVFLGGQDPRIKAAVCVSFMTTWRDFLLNRANSHTFMTYVPLLPKELDFPEILGLRVPLPTLVLNDREDALFTMPEMVNAENILKEIYVKAKFPEHFKCSYFPGPHKFDEDMQKEAFGWFDKWLKEA
jgi:dienelactone hydrolase